MNEYGRSIRFDNTTGIGEQAWRMAARFVLASASPRRRQLLERAGFDFDVVASEVPEVPEPGEAAAPFARRAAADKASAVASLHPDRWVLAADTVVVVEGQILGKPTGPAEACAMLERLSGRAHEVLTGVALVGPDGTVRETLVVESVVEFRFLPADEINAYVRTGEPLDKAGAYAIQGGAARFVGRVAGSYSNIVGLPLDEVGALLQRHGVPGGPRQQISGSSGQ